MFANWQRRRLRARFSPLINNELPDTAAARLRAAIGADAVLAAEFERLNTALSAARSLPEAPLPSHFAASLAAELDLVDQPVRARYSELLDGTLPEAEAAALLAEIEASPELATEFAFVSRIVDVCHSLPEEPLPAGFAHRLARSLDAIDAETAAAAAPARPRLAPRRNLAFAGLLAVVLGFGIVASRQLPSHGGRTMPAPVAALPAPEPEPAAEPAAETTAPEAVGAVPDAAPVAKVTRPQPPVAPAPPSEARPVAAESPRPRATVRARSGRSSAPEVTAPRAVRQPQPRPPANLGAGMRVAVNLLNQPVVSRPDRAGFAPARPGLTPQPSSGSPRPAVDTTPAAEPRPERRPERRPLYDVRVPPSEQPSPVAAAPTREIPSPRLLNRYASSAVALEFTTASLAEPSLPRATLPDLEFAGQP